MKRFLFILFFVALAFPRMANARLTILCEVTAGMGDPYIRNVEFINGKEYAKARGEYAVSNFGAYALIWFSQEQVAILEIDVLSFYSYSDRFSLEDLRRLFMINGSVLAEQVNGYSGRLWEISCKEFHKWIDPRLRDLR